MTPEGERLHFLNLFDRIPTAFADACSWRLVFRKIFSEDAIDFPSYEESMQPDSNEKAYDLKVRIKWWSNTRSVCKKFKDLADSVFPFVQTNSLIKAVQKGSFSSVVFLCNMLPNPSSLDDNALWQSVMNHDLEIFLYLRKQNRGDPSVWKDSSFRYAVKTGQFEVVKNLLEDPRVDPTSFQNDALNQAVRNEHMDIFKLLVQDNRIDITCNDNYALRTAVGFKSQAFFDEIMKFPEVDPSAKNNEAVATACYSGYTKRLKVLLNDPRVDPSINEQCLIRAAASNSPADCLKVLLQHPKVHPMYDYTIENAAYNARWKNVLVLLKDKRVNPNLMTDEIWNRFPGLVFKVSERKVILIPIPFK